MTYRNLFAEKALERNSPRQSKMIVYSNPSVRKRRLFERSRSKSYKTTSCSSVIEQHFHFIKEKWVCDRMKNTKVWHEAMQWFNWSWKISGKTQERLTMIWFLSQVCTCRGPAPGYEAAAAVHWGAGHIQPGRSFKFGPGTLTGFGNALWHCIHVFQGGLTRKQRGGVSAATDRLWEWQMGWRAERRMNWNLCYVTQERWYKTKSFYPDHRSQDNKTKNTVQNMNEMAQCHDHVLTERKLW